MSNTNPNANRDAIRSQIFASKGVKSKEIDFFGTRIEIRQPRLKDIISAQETKDRHNAVVGALISYAYVPGTDTKLFDDTDAEAFLNMPFGADLLRVSEALGELSNVNFLDTEQSSEKTDGDTP